MIKDVIAAGGAGFLIPVVLFALLLYAVRGLFGLHGRRSQHRREFLEHWDTKRVDDDLWLEVTIRHLYGTHLPAHIIRSALAHPHTSQALLDLSELWDFFDYDPQTRAVAWKHRRHHNAKTRSLLRHWPTLRYFLLAGVGAFAAYLATRVGGFNQWAFAILAMVMIAAAFLSLWHGEALRVAATVGESWIKRINAESAQHQAVDGAI
ncbi:MULTISPECIES: hypothetical protein [Luteimonas]|uniref:hypothetical protein n=1 Tax=Luteimonas TaxID=83614 RepID=UPI000C7A12FF|nr:MULTISPECIES: hypothetical protein [Luteimonas]